MAPCCDWNGCTGADVEHCVSEASQHYSMASPSTVGRSNVSRVTFSEMPPELGGQDSRQDTRSVTISPAARSDAAGQTVPTIRTTHRQHELGCRGHGRRLLLSVEFQAFMILVILVDVSVFVAESVISGQEGEAAIPLWTRWVSYITLVLYGLEILLKLGCFSWHVFVRDLWNLLDVAIVLVSAALIEGPGGVIVAAKLSKVVFRAIRAVAKGVRLCLRLKPMGQAAKNKVSKNKYRYVDLDNNFDLDLSYISGDLIAMGVPAEGCIHFHRNPLSEVARFFEFNHAGSFRVYNCCPEMPYPEEPFADGGGSVVSFNIQDHTPPLMEQFVSFLNDARTFRRTDSTNVLAIHCKAGKGRTGSLCCAWLLYARKRESPEKALETFANRRTDMRIKGKLRGVETPSQVRYVNQVFQHIQNTNSWLYSSEPTPPVPTPAAKLEFLNLEGDFFAHPKKLGRVRILFQQLGGAVPSPQTLLEIDAVDASTVVIPLGGVTVEGDIRVSFFQERGSGFSAHSASLAAPKNFNQAKGLLCYFCFHTAFLPLDEAGAGECRRGSLRLSVLEIDRACKNVQGGRKKGRFGDASGIALHYVSGHRAGSPARAALKSRLSSRGSRFAGTATQAAAWAQGAAHGGKEESTDWDLDASPKVAEEVSPQSRRSASPDSRPVRSEASGRQPSTAGGQPDEDFLLV